MVRVLRFCPALLAWMRNSQVRREAEILYLRQQLIVLRRSAPARPRLKAIDRLIFVCLYRLFPSLIDASIVFQPETLLRWHRRGFRLFWRWKSRRWVGRPALPADIRSLVRRISRENPLWGAPRIHGELLKLGIEIAQSSVAKYMIRRRGPPSQGWKTFLRNHAPEIAAIDLFVVPTVGFRLLYGLVTIHLERRRLIWTNVTTNPTAEWIARQITEAFPWGQAPRYLTVQHRACSWPQRSMPVRLRQKIQTLPRGAGHRVALSCSSRNIHFVTRCPSSNASGHSQRTPLFRPSQFFDHTGTHCNFDLSRIGYARAALRTERAEAAVCK
jgi:hypothetical protein